MVKVRTATQVIEVVILDQNEMHVLVNVNASLGMSTAFAEFWPKRRTDPKQTLSFRAMGLGSPGKG